MARLAVEDLTALFADDADPSCSEVLKSVAASGLFDIPEVLKPLSGFDFDLKVKFEPTGEDRIDAWAVALRASFSEVSRYRSYVLDLSPYGTHQGVKGLEFPRVMVIADDGSARFKGSASYEKLLGAKPKSERDLQNEADGKETTFDRTRRLLYVPCMVQILTAVEGSVTSKIKGSCITMVGVVLFLIGSFLSIGQFSGFTIPLFCSVLIATYSLIWGGKQWEK